MTKSESSGAMGESRAADAYLERGYEIRERNFRCRFGEIDIVAEKGGILAFVEVKTRKAGSLLLPREAVDRHKQARLIKTASMYLARNPELQLQPRFDVAEVTMLSHSMTVEILENAFSLD